jgi:hypothetical protein
MYSLTRIDGKSRFHYREFDPPRQGLPASFEAMYGRVTRNGVRGRIRFWERVDFPGGVSKRCGTLDPRGHWVQFYAKRISST